MKTFLVLLCLVVGFEATAVESPSVPNTIEFAGLNLKLSERARKKIQAEVDALTRHPKYFQIKVDRLQIYFPIIERVFREEGLPEDFKYLVLQESALISDAVSSSNAVGFWQFKKATAQEVGLRVDRSIDERLNIVSSTRGAAKYIKKNNRLYFDNWIHALLAYQQGPGGAQRLVKKKYQGSRSMPIDSQTHWYVIKFLAHKIAFEQVKSDVPKLHLVEFYEGQGNTLKEIAQRERLDYESVKLYNKWLKQSKVPTDKPYAVILPYEKSPAMLAAGSGKQQQPEVRGTRVATSSQYPTYPSRYPEVKTNRNPSKGIRINGIKGVRLTRDMDLKTLEQSTGVTVKRLLYYNDVAASKKPQAGELWYLKPKRSKASEEYHIVASGEDLWSISQKYGIRLSKLRKKNHIGKRQTEVKTGRVLWLRATRPSEIPVAYVDTNDGNNTPKPNYKAEPRVNNSTMEYKEIDKQYSSTRAEATVKSTDDQESYQAEPSGTPAVAEKSKPTKNPEMVHTVQSGETLYGISKKYQVSIEDLRDWNQLDASSVLSVGQQLQIGKSGERPAAKTPVPDQTEARFRRYSVKPGDTLYQIAREHDATIKQLMEWNEKTDFNLSVGEELKVEKLP